jgi:hypothetical protein
MFQYALTGDSTPPSVAYEELHKNIIQRVTQITRLVGKTDFKRGKVSNTAFMPEVS